MKVDTQFGIGETVFFLYGTKILESIVTGIMVTIEKNKGSVYYNIEGQDFEYKEDRLYPTRRALASKWLADNGVNEEMGL